MNYSTIHAYQQKEIASGFINKLKTKKALCLEAFPGVKGTQQLLCFNKKIYIPVDLREHIVQWYHTYLLHPGMNRTYFNMHQHFYWPKMESTIRSLLKYCHVCQMSKISNRNYGKLKIKEDIDDCPWETLCVDLIGPYKVTKNVPKEITLLACTMIDPATGWFEIAQLPNKRSDTVANIVETTWLTRYPRPLKCIMDRGPEFLGHDFKSSLLQDEYDIHCAVASRTNPQTNSILERAHQVLGNQIRAMELSHHNVDLDDPWSGVLAAVAFAMRSTYHTTLQATPG